VNILATSRDQMAAALSAERTYSDPRYVWDDSAKPIGARLHAIHRELRTDADLADLQRIGVALYEPENDLVKTFAESNIDINGFRHYEAHLSQCESLHRLAQTHMPRIIDEVKPGAAGRIGELYRNGIRSSMTVPIYGQGRLFGFIFFDSNKPAFFNGAMPDRLLPYAKIITLLLIHEVMTANLVRAVVKTAQEISRHRDYETATHLERMSNYARLIANEGAYQWGLTDEFIEHLFWFAPLHDIGKVGVRDIIMLKPGKLTEAEMEEMKLHVMKGVDIIDAITHDFGLQKIPYIDVARNIIAFHHENVDGSGYPTGARRGDIPIEGRIIAVADVFDALTSDRPYKKKWSNQDAVDHLRKLVGQKFDGDCVEALIRRMDEVIAIQQRFQADVDI